MIDTHFSTYSNSQTTEDGGKTKWKFSNFEIKDTYGSIEFRMSDSGTVRQETYINFAGSSLQNSSSARLLYETGWVTKWAVGGNVSNISVQQFTADFVLTFKPKIITGLKFIQHITDEEVHITSEERLFIDSIQHWPVDFFYSTLTDGFIAPSGGKTGANSIQLTQAHFTSGIIKQIEIPYYGGSGAMGYLCV